MSTDSKLPSFFDEAGDRTIAGDVRALPKGYRIAEFEIVKIRETNHCTAAHPARNDTFADFADDVMCVDGAEASALATQNTITRKGEERSEWLRTR